MRGHLSATLCYNEKLFPLANPVEPRWIPSLYPCQEITPYTGGMLLRDGDLKGLPLTLGAYPNIGKDQPYTRGKFCDREMCRWFISEKMSFPQQEAWKKRKRGEKNEKINEEIKKMKLWKWRWKSKGTRKKWMKMRKQCKHEMSSNPW